jgi:hypothetical protein
MKNGFLTLILWATKVQPIDGGLQGKMITKHPISLTDGEEFEAKRVNIWWGGFGQEGEKSYTCLPYVSCMQEEAQSKVWWISWAYMVEGKGEERKERRGYVFVVVLTLYKIKWISLVLGLFYEGNCGSHLHLFSFLRSKLILVLVF